MRIAVLIALLQSASAHAGYARDLIELQKRVAQGQQLDFNSVKEFSRNTSNPELFIDWLSQAAKNWPAQKSTPANFNPLVQIVTSADGEFMCFFGIENLPTSPKGVVKQLRMQSSNGVRSIAPNDLAVTDTFSMELNKPQQCPTGLVEITATFADETVQRSFFMPKMPKRLPSSEFAPRLTRARGKIQVSDSRLVQLSNVLGERFKTASTITHEPNGARVYVEHSVRSPAPFGNWNLSIGFLVPAPE